MNKKKLVIAVIVALMMSFSVGTAATYTHTHWRNGPYYELENNKDIWKRYYGCSHRRSYSYTGFSFKTLDFDLEVKQPSGVTSAGGVGFETGTSILKGRNFDIKNISNATTLKHGYKDVIRGQGTALNNNSYSNVTKYELNLAEGIYTLKAQMKDKYPGTTVTKTKDFYVGTYPTVSCDIELIDNNQKDSHIDSIKVSNIKLKSTYKPQKLIFELYKGDTYTGKSYTTILNNASAYSTGYNSTFSNIEATNIGLNLKPGETINISVRVVDGRGTGTTSVTDPNAPKYAKYSNIDVF